MTSKHNDNVLCKRNYASQKQKQILKTRELRKVHSADELSSLLTALVRLTSLYSLGGGID